MKRKLTIFQAVILGVLGFSAIVAMLIFAGVGGLGSKGKGVGPVIIWGTQDEQIFNTIIQQLSENDDRLRGVVYKQKDPRTYYSELTSALAGGVGPDIFLLRQDFIEKNRDKIIPIPFSNLPQQKFVDTFVEVAELFLSRDGVLGVPYSVDPLVLYWNRDILQNNGFAKPPEFWDEIFDISKKVTEKDDSGNIKRSAVAFGEFDNVAHAKAIMSTLIMQAGGSITDTDANGVLRTSLISVKRRSSPAQSALRFFTEFANPSKTVYSWNRSIKNSRDTFIANNLALYFGFASELPIIRRLNPNLNFGVAPMPQIRGSKKFVTFANVDAFAIPRVTKNLDGAISTAFILSGSKVATMLSESIGIPSARRDVLSAKFDGPDLVFRNMAIIAESWLDPDPQKTAKIFKKMIESVTSGVLRLSEAVGRADKEINNLLGF